MYIKPTINKRVKYIYIYIKDNLKVIRALRNYIVKRAGHNETMNGNVKSESGDIVNQNRIVHT